MGRSEKEVGNGEDRGVARRWTRGNGVRKGIQGKMGCHSQVLGSSLLSNRAQPDGLQLAQSFPG